MRFGFAGGQNLFHEFEAQLGDSGEPAWVPRGGHRLWIAPEDPVRSYAPDNAASRCGSTDGVIEATQPVEDLTGIEKQITVKMADAGAAVEVVHALRNAGRAAVELAPWALTMMAHGRPRHPRLSAARQHPADARAHQSAGHVGVHGSGRSALAALAQISRAAAGPGERDAAEAGRRTTTHLGRLSC